MQKFPIPQTVSPEIQQLISILPPWNWNLHPANIQEWKSLAQKIAEQSKIPLPELREKLGVTLTQGEIGGVPILTLTPKDLPAVNRDRILIGLHGGGYVLGTGESGTLEATLMAGIGGFQVIYIDFRLAPDFLFPAAIDDVMIAYCELLKTTSSDKIGVFGSSSGGAMALILALRAKAEGLQLPGAIAAGTPWSDMSKTGDTYYTNEGIDNVVVSYDGWLGDAARLYAGDHDLKNPMLSPIYGDVSGFPPIILTSGTRDLFLSNTVRMHLKLRQANVPADLIVFEGLSHAQYQALPQAPETQVHFKELKRFFERNLK